MTDAKLLRTCDLDPNMIDVSGRLRPVSEAAVASLIASVEELGVVKDEVIVREARKRDGRHPLVAGAHRVVACARMGRPVPAKVYQCSDDWARLMEVDDNLAGAELTVLDTAVFLAERKALFEKLHPEAIRGIAGAKARWNATDNLSVASFAASSAEKLGSSERHVYRLLQIGAALEPGEVGLLRGAKRPVTLSDLQCLAKIGAAEERAFVARQLSEGHAKGAAASRAAYAARNGTGKPPQDPVEAAFKALREAWERTGKRARRRFVDEYQDELQELLAAPDDDLHASLMASIRDGLDGTAVSASEPRPWSGAFPDASADDNA